MMTVEKRVYNKLWKIAFLLDFGFENFSNAVFFLVVKNSISLEIFLIEVEMFANFSKISLEFDAELFDYHLSFILRLLTMWKG